MISEKPVTSKIFMTSSLTLTMRNILSLQRFFAASSTRSPAEEMYSKPPASMTMPPAPEGSPLSAASNSWALPELMLPVSSTTDNVPSDSMFRCMSRPPLYLQIYVLSKISIPRT